MHQESGSNVTIPPILYAAMDQAPFRHCIQCEKELLESGSTYFIEKAFRQVPAYGSRETIFDYAVCEGCAEGWQEQMSTESMLAIQLYFESKAKEAQERNGAQKDPDLETCYFSGEGVASLEEFQIVARCTGGHLDQGQPPILISGKVMDGLLEVLSEHTKDFLDELKNKILPPDPAFMEPGPVRKVVFL